MPYRAAPDPEAEPARDASRAALAHGVARSAPGAREDAAPARRGAPGATARHPWWRGLELFAPDDPNAARFRARQLATVVGFTPLTFCANLLNAALLCWVFRHAPAIDWLLVWAAITVALNLGALGAWRASRLAGPRRSASMRAIRAAERHALLLAALWSVPPLALFAQATAEQQLLLACLTTGMMCAGGFVLAAVPTAGVTYVTLIGIASAIALAMSRLEHAAALGVLLVAYCTIAAAGVLRLSRSFGEHLIAEASADGQREVIGLLLRDFEENASDVLWETDAGGKLRHASTRLLGALDVEGEPAATFTALLATRDRYSGATDEQPVAALGPLFAAGAPFRDVVLRLACGRHGVRWWSITAKPVVEGRGEISGWRGVLSDVTEARRAHRQLLTLAHHDSLTGLANRYQFLGAVKDALSLVGDGAQCAALSIDLDGFKAVNDAHGHAYGDLLLREVAERLKACVGETGLVSRLGGDEFAVLMPAIDDAADASRVAARVVASLSRPAVLGGIRMSAGASVGVAIGPRHGEHVEALMSSADLAMYRAKRDGKNAWRLFEPEMGSRNRRRLRIEQALQDVVRRGELRLVFQPQVALGDWRPAAFEALLRWEHPELGPIPPAEFVPIAEESGAIEAIGAWVLVEACRQARQWPREIGVAINVSPVQAMSGSLVDAVRHALDASGIAPARLELEITESVFLNEAGNTLGTLHALRGIGARIALDDFGIGYSSLAYLRRFPFDTLKIDRAFVRELAERHDSRAIVRTIIAMAHTLGIGTVAEGVEDAAQLAVLREQGCGAVQGFLLASPMAAGAVGDFLAHWASDARPASTPEEADTVDA